MIEKVNSNANIMSMLQTLQSYQREAAGAPASVYSPNAPSFSEAIQKSVNKVNDLQNHSQAMTSAFERGEDVPLTDVVLSMQKSSLAFEATLQVRNKVLKAYDEIMNMPV
jgi:flagellar hook-basal body complex protein FliE